MFASFLSILVYVSNISAEVKNNSWTISFFGIWGFSSHTKESGRFMSHKDVSDYHGNVSRLAVLEERLHAAG